MIRWKHIVDIAYIIISTPMWKRGRLRLQIRIGRDVRCCVPGVARPRGRGRLSRNVSPGLTKAFKLSVTAELNKRKRRKGYERLYSTLSNNIFLLIRRRLSSCATL